MTLWLVEATYVSFLNARERCEFQSGFYSEPASTDKGTKLEKKSDKSYPVLLASSRRFINRWTFLYEEASGTGSQPFTNTRRAALVSHGRRAEIPRGIRVFVEICGAMKAGSRIHCSRRESSGRGRLGVDLPAFIVYESLIPRRVHTWLLRRAFAVSLFMNLRESYRSPPRGCTRKSDSSSSPLQGSRPR